MLYGCFQKLWYPQIINFNRVFHYKPSILGYPYFWKHPYHALSVYLFNCFALFRSVHFLTQYWKQIVWQWHFLECSWLSLFQNSASCGTLNGVSPRHNQPVACFVMQARVFTWDRQGSADDACQHEDMISDIFHHKVPQD